MNCPSCNVQLMTAGRPGIDYCPQCRGLWIERGGIDQIIAPVAASSESPRYEGNPEHPRYDQRYDSERPHGQSVVSDFFG